MKRQRGHAMIELAISAGVMVTCLGGTFEFGYTFYVYNQLVTAVGNGGRYAALRSYRAATPDDIEKGKAAIRNMVVYGDSRPAPNAVPLVTNLKPEQVKVEWIPAESGAPSAVNVSITGYNVDAVFGKFTFTGRPGVEFPFVGRYAPTESEP
jgi:Flp pilus assembly protein TadG